jgi:hypothetical protein
LPENVAESKKLNYDFTLVESKRFNCSLCLIENAAENNEVGCAFYLAESITFSVQLEQ